MIDKRRATTMRERLGDASELIESDQYLPLYRNRQINHPELFAFSVNLARKKNAPARYFATLWSSKNLKKTIDWIQKLINLAKSKTAEVVRDFTRRRQERKAQKALDQPMNREARRRYEKMKRKLLINPPRTA